MNKLSYEEEIRKILEKKSQCDLIESLIRNLKSDEAKKKFLENLINDSKKKKDKPDKEILNLELKIKDEEDRKFLKEVGSFYEDCKSGEYVESGDDRDKRAAYANGDYYLEDYESELIDDNEGIRLFSKYLKKADEYFSRGRYDVASQAYKVLIDVYNLDQENNCFIADDDFPDANLENCVFSCDKFFEMEKKYSVSLERMKSREFDYIEFCKKNLDKDEKYYKELLENLIKEKRWGEVIGYGGEIIKKTERSNWHNRHYYDSYNEWVRDAYRESGDDNKSYEYQKGIYYYKPNTGRSLKLYAETREYAQRINSEEKFKNEDAACLAQVLLYEGYYDESLKVAKNFNFNHSGGAYNPVKVCAYFFTYIGMKDVNPRKSIKSLFNKMKTEEYANTPYKPLMSSITDKKFSKQEQTGEFLYGAILCYRKMIDNIAENKYRSEYGLAAIYTGIIKEIYGHLGKENEFKKYYGNLLEKYRRFHALKEELNKVM